MTREFKENLGNDMTKTKLGYYIDELEKIEKKILNSEFEKIGITLSQFRVLNWLWRKGELTQKEIHQLIQIKPSSLTNLLNILIKKGLVVRKFDDNDARVRKIALTDKSKEIESSAWHIIDSFDNRIKKILTEDEYYTTLKCLDKLIKNL
ncbi:MarR family winged helix-turn-helix transcriptional regulator [Wukongibacter sp. M2B1]|uniref:MarR family winged helix-turn-helix transcriptional regulator n=1 Tax=Wukongibacter sp. M2B1 TaxID=3088895 RepID=UPI003D7A8B2B